MYHLILLSCLIAFVSAQAPYVCNPVTACATSDFNRKDESGCQYWCYLLGQDISMVESLDCPDFHLAYMKWKGNAAECDRAAYVSAHQQILPRTCTTELNDSFGDLATLDAANSQTISGTDVQIWCDRVKLIGAATGRISQAQFRTWWDQHYERVEDLECDRKH